MISALVIGLFGSLHCVGMCGPVMMTFMGPKTSWHSFLVYHSGRVFSYVVIGSFLGLIGTSVALFHAQQIAVILLGVALILLYGIPSLRNGIEKFYYHSRLYRYLHSLLSTNISRKRRRMLSGMANGFFPCGLTYVAAATAVAQGSFLGGVSYMALFGLGTIPSLLMLALVGNTISIRFRRFIPKAVSLIAILSGSLMIFRGLLFTIPDFNQMVQSNASFLITVCGI